MKTHTYILKSIIVGVIILSIGLTSSAISNLKELNSELAGTTIESDQEWNKRDTTEMAHKESTSRKFILEIEDPQKVDYTIYNEFGEIVKQNKIMSKNGVVNINVSELDNGIYQLEIETKNSNKTIEFIK